MSIRADSSSKAPATPPKVPAWAIPRAPLDDAVEAAFMAGSALNSLDLLVRSDPVWAGAWRCRLALFAGAAAVRLAGRTEDAAALRDAWVLRRPGDDPGPAGNLVAAFRRLVAYSPTLDRARLDSVLAGMGIGSNEALGEVPDLLEEVARARQPAPRAAAAVAAAVLSRRPDAEPLAWWLADLTLAACMRWPAPVPVLSTQIHSPILRVAGRRARPEGAGAEMAVLAAAAAGAAEACRIATDIAIQAERLLEVAPKLRAKGAGEGIGLLLSDDAVSGTLTTPNLSRWASRRLFERLEALEAVRELSGRDSFRLYGL
jgi:hypothetical protein